MTEQEYNDLLAENQNHGRILLFDLYMREVHGTGVPSSYFNPERGSVVCIQLDEIKEATIHGNKVAYQKLIREDTKTVITLSRVESIPPDFINGRVFLPLSKIGSHYHVIDKAHGIFKIPNGADETLIRSTVGLGANLLSLDDALTNLEREASIYREETRLDNKLASSRGAYPELACSMLRAYITGFKSAAESVGKSDIAERVNAILGTIPYS